MLKQGKCVLIYFEFSYIRRHLFNLLDYVIHKSEKIEFVKKKMAQRQISKYCVNFCIIRKLYLAKFIQFIGVWIDTYVFYQSVLQKKTWIWSLCVAKT